MKLEKLRYVLVAIILAVVLSPLYWLIATSFKSNKEITQDGTLYPHAPTVDNYLNLFSQKQFADYLINSLVITSVSVFLALVFGTMGAYCIARFTLPFNLEKKTGMLLLLMRSIGKIETGQVSASLSTLQAVAQALNVPMAGFFAAAEDRRDCSYVRSSQGVVIERRGTKAGHQYRLLGHSLAGDLVIEPYLITLSEEAVPYTAFQHAGTEMIYMLTGRVAYRHADKTYELGPGDTLMFDATAAHGPETLIELPMTYLSIISYARST